MKDRQYVLERDARRRHGESLSYDERELRFHANAIIASNSDDNLAALVARAYLSLIEAEREGR